MKPFSLEFWMGIQLIIDLLFLVLLFGFVRRLNREGQGNNQMSQQDDDEAVKKDEGLAEMRSAALLAVERATGASRNIMDRLEPLVRGAEEAGTTFEKQIADKRRLIKSLNEALDSKIISINLLLSRAEMLLNSQNLQSLNAPASFDSRSWEHQERTGYGKYPDVFDQQKNIIEWYSRGVDIETIASKLSMPRGEVELVINLKKKFREMEKKR